MISFSLSLFIAEKIIGKYRHQITYREANYYSYKCYANDNLLPFTLPQNKICPMSSPSGEFDVRVTTNSLGYRGKEIAFDKKPGTKRILVLGDSFTFGVGIRDEETYPYQLEQVLKEKGYSNAEVVNAGYADAFSPDSYYLYLKERGIKLAPDIVLVGFFVYNDISDLAETVWEKTDEDGLPEKISSCCRVVDGGILRNKMVDFKYRIPVLRESQFYLFLINTLQNKFHLFKPGGYLPTKDETNLGCAMSPYCIHNYKSEEEKVYKVLSAAREISEKEGVQFSVVLIPLDHQLNPQKYNFWFIDQHNLDFVQKRLGKEFGERRINYLDLYPVFDKARDKGSPFLPKDLHFNGLGGRIAAESIADYLVANGWMR